MNALLNVGLDPAAYQDRGLKSSQRAGSSRKLRRASASTPAKICASRKESDGRFSA